MVLQTQGLRKYPSTSEVLASSAGLGWSKFSAELRSHVACEIPDILPHAVEICLVVAGNDNSMVRRTGLGPAEEAAPRDGGIWLSPAGIGKGISITAPIPATMHLYLPAALFDGLNEDFNLPLNPAQSIRYAAGMRDEVIETVGQSILSELGNETASGRMYVETAAVTLAARLLQKYCDGGACAPIDVASLRADHSRLRRVLDYISDNLEEKITLEQLAHVARLSVFHFGRMFTRTIGVSPSRYVSRMRLEQAMAELAIGKLPLAEIALKAGFSSQASFTRAFHRATGVTPGEYRTRRR
ncbi:helix-turn-helix domain-containing protein [Terricaulis silvestris]|uniref:Bacillibactin transport regulator n=1 Tax=Terricaulis silvestris TaxID=2686094 RepID=A0A6I6MKP5_9CAUL|nr:AraC family transcriptional regulator [Terricaulis silvestris]QGZ93726.1 Bacillibactin transport regulator [Terricaulis silvestris]